MTGRDLSPTATIRVLMPLAAGVRSAPAPPADASLDVTRSPALLFEAMPRATANSISIRPFFFYARAFIS